MQVKRARRVVGDFGLLVAGPFIGPVLGMPIAVAGTAASAIVVPALPVPMVGGMIAGLWSLSWGAAVFLIVRRRGSTRHAQLLSAVAAGCVLAFWGAFALVAAGAPGD